MSIPSDPQPTAPSGHPSARPDPSTESSAGEEDPGAALGENDVPEDAPATAPSPVPSSPEAKPRQAPIYPGSRD